MAPKKATYKSIAALAGVGTATVERVLNGRGGVRPETVEKVLLAARQLNYPRALPAQHSGIIRIEVILIHEESRFFERLSAAFRRIASTLDPIIQVQVNFVNAFDPLSISGHINNPNMHRSAMIISCPGTPEIQQAMNDVINKGIPVVQLVNQNFQNAEYVGIDNVAAGRVAGMLMSELGTRAGTVVAFRNSIAHQCQEDRIIGFSDYMARADQSNLTFKCVLFGQDNRVKTKEAFLEAAAEWPDLVGIYNAGGGNIGLIEALRQQERDIFVVTHELADDTSEALKDGTIDVVLDQLPETQARRSLDLVLARIGLLSRANNDQAIRFTTITKYNI